MKNISKPLYICRNKTHWKGMFLLILLISLLWCLVLFIPRSGSNEKDGYFWLMAAMGLGIVVLILYTSLLRHWSKTWIQDGTVYSDLATRFYLPYSQRMPLEEIKEICFIFNGEIFRNKVAYPNARMVTQLKAQLGEKIDKLFTQGPNIAPVNMENDKYRFPAVCGSLRLLDHKGKSMVVELKTLMKQSNLKEVKKFLTFMPAGVNYTWKYGKVGIHTYSTLS